MIYTNYIQKLLQLYFGRKVNMIAYNNSYAMTGDDQLVLAGVQLAPFVNLSVHELNKVKLK
jgi:hypothetical protein